MPTNKGKVKKVKGAMVSVSPTKKGKKAGSRRWGSATTVQDLNLAMDEKDAGLGQDEFAQKIEVMMRRPTDLTSRVQATEDQQREVAASPSDSQSTSHPVRRRARCQLSPSQEPDLSDEVRQRIAKRMRQLPIFTGATPDEDPSMDEKPLAPWCQ